MKKAADKNLIAYNSFCKGLYEGSILYNINPTNLWGDYLLVINKACVHIGSTKTYTLQLLGLKKEDGKYIPRNTNITVTPDDAKDVFFLKYVGHCKFELLPVLKNVDVNVGLVSIYGSTDLHKYTRKLNIRKPQKHRYDKDGRPVIKELKN